MRYNHVHAHKQVSAYHRPHGRYRLSGQGVGDDGIPTRPGHSSALHSTARKEGTSTANKISTYLYLTYPDLARLFSLLQPFASYSRSRISLPAGKIHADKNRPQPRLCQNVAVP